MSITPNNWMPLMAVYTGNGLGNLLAVAAAGANNLDFAATAGVAYVIAVDGADGGSGQFSLRLELVRPPSVL